MIHHLKPLHCGLRKLWQRTPSPAATGHGCHFVGSRQRFRRSPDEPGTVMAQPNFAPMDSRAPAIPAALGSPRRRQTLLWPLDFEGAV
ncbi:MAG: hypothetical protein ACK59A_13145 [Cyanobacteriota bacterium]